MLQNLNLRQIDPVKNFPEVHDHHLMITFSEITIWNNCKSYYKNLKLEFDSYNHLQNNMYYENLNKQTTADSTYNPAHAQIQLLQDIKYVDNLKFKTHSIALIKS